MSTPRRKYPLGTPPESIRSSRKGVFIVLAAILMVVLFAFLSFGIDTGLIALEQSRLQNGADAAALAASQEITANVQIAGEEGQDVNSISIAAARQMAVDIAEANGVYINPERDVTFGKRTYNPGNGEWTTTWGDTPYNVVKVEPRRDNHDMSARDSRVPLSFGWAVGVPTVPLRASAVSFVEARDMVVVLDFSASMNDDSQYAALNRFSQDSIEGNMRDIADSLTANLGNLSFDQQYLTIVGQPQQGGGGAQITVTFGDREVIIESSKDLSNVVLEFENGYRYKFDGLSGKTGTFRGVGGYNGRRIVGCWVKSGNNASGDGPGYGERFRDTNEAVRAQFGLDNISYPYSSGSWNEFIDFCRNDNDLRNAGTRHKFGKYNFVNFLLKHKYHHHHTNELWRTPHYPFTAVKDGFSLFLSFLEDLDFGDEVGIVSYDDNSRIEQTLSDNGVSASLNGNLISDDYDTLDTIQRHKQAGHYATFTAMGSGVDSATDMLMNHSRHGARPTMVLMTDGLANRHPGNFSLPGDWDWDEFTDYDGDGNSNYSSHNRSVQYVFYQAIQAHRQGITIHTMSVGASADRQLMTAIAHACGGIHISVPGGATVAELEEQMMAAFGQIAARVPPPQLVYEME
ncbi:MAG: pilus assembly protein TadG-related protein [Pirellulaceae bacterium]